VESIVFKMLLSPVLVLHKLSIISHLCWNYSSSFVEQLDLSFKVTELNTQISKAKSTIMQSSSFR